MNVSAVALSHWLNIQEISTMSMLLQLLKFITTLALLGTLLCTQNQATETCEMTEDLRRSAVNKALEAIGCDSYTCRKSIMSHISFMSYMPRD